MKKILLLILLSASALISRAQSPSALADTAFSHKEYSKAFDYYAEVLKTDPANAKANRRMGYCMMISTEGELNSTRYFVKAIELDPADKVSMYYLGIVFMNAAKDPKNASSKSDFKAKSATYLKKAADLGSEDAKSAIKDLNTI